MILLTDPGISDVTASTLKSWQDAIDALPAYPERVERAKSDFDTKKKGSTRAFKEIKEQLANMCAGARRCVYCEDSAADEIEHHHPKTLYPEKVFVWANYLYSCGPCNGPKNNKFAVINLAGELVIVSRAPKSPVVPPAGGNPALIDPRLEDPLEYLVLDLRGGTFRFTPHPLANAVQQIRAAYTIDLLGLNRKDFLLAARREAFQSYAARMYQYVDLKDRGAHQQILQRQLEALWRMQHPTVLREMIRQRKMLGEIAELIETAPELAVYI